MGIKGETFSTYGPWHLTDVNWQNTAHKRAVAASLIKGAYILERDRQKRRTEHEALAPPWWESFNFELVRALKDTKDGSYYGAIYKYKEDQSCPTSQDQPPKYVIAFRGTLIKRKTFRRDLKLDILVIFNGIHHSTRFKTALEEVGCMVDEAIKERIDADTVWLVGHSLGASIALAVGKEIVMNKGYHLQTYLFNSPFSAIPFDTITNDETLKAALRLFKGGVATAVSSVASSVFAHLFGTRRTQSNDLKKLLGWVPNVFVNRDDFICAEYIGFFKIREGLYKLGANSAANMLSKQLSLTTIFSLFGGRDQKPSYYVHSAYVTLNAAQASGTSSVEEFSLARMKSAHQLSQWWSLDIDCETELHEYNPDEETDD